MLIKVVLLTVVLLFLLFFPSLYTLFYYYKKYGKYIDGIGEKVFSVLLGTLIIDLVIVIIISISCSIVN